MEIKYSDFSCDELLALCESKVMHGFQEAGTKTDELVYLSYEAIQQILNFKVVLLQWSDELKGWFA